MASNRKGARATALSRLSRVKREDKIQRWDEKRWPKNLAISIRPRKRKDKKLDSFPRFSQLPAELRLKIWEFSIGESRVIELEPHLLKLRVSDFRRFDTHLAKGIEYGFVAKIDEKTKQLEGHRLSAPPPAAIFACIESHIVASKLYFLAFGGFGMQRETWVNFDRDFIKMPENGDYSWEYVTDKEYVKYGILDFTTQAMRHAPQRWWPSWSKPTTAVLQFCHFLSSWTSLERVVVVVPEYAREEPPWIDVELLNFWARFGPESYEKTSTKNDPVLSPREYCVPEIVETFRPDSTESDGSRQPFHQSWSIMNELRRQSRVRMQNDGVEIEGLSDLRESSHYLHRENFELEEWKEI